MYLLALDTCLGSEKKATEGRHLKAKNEICLKIRKNKILRKQKRDVTTRGKLCCIKVFHFPDAQAGKKFFHDTINRCSENRDFDENS